MAAKNLYIPPSQSNRNGASLNSDDGIYEETMRKNKFTTITDQGSLENGTTQADDDGKRVVSIEEAFDLSGGFGRY